MTPPIFLSMVPTKRIQLAESPDYHTTCLTTLRSLMCLNPNRSWDIHTEPEKLYIDDKDDSIYQGQQPILETGTFDSTKRLERLRAIMKSSKVTAYIIPSEDAHQSEYTAKADQRREYVSGFTGSAGVAIVTQTEAALFTDSRYFIQAGLQLDNNWTLLKQGRDDWVSWTLHQVSYEMDELKSWGTVAVDPRLISASLGKSLVQKCHFWNLKFVTDLNFNLVDKLKKSCGDQDSDPMCPIEKYDIKYAGQSTKSKISDIRAQMETDGSFCYVVSMLDAIAWVLNLRGGDVLFTPIFFSYLIITQDKVCFYVQKPKMSKAIEEYLVSELGDELEIHGYNQIWDHMPALSGPKDLSITLDFNANYSIYNNIPLSVYDVKFHSICTELKGIKNEAEKENNKIAQLHDSVAIIRTFAWISRRIALGKAEGMTEWDVCEQSYKFRSQMPNFKGLSFATIAGSGSNSAIVHYEPSAEEHSELDLENILLFDSGGQYLNGTTDITRTIHLGGRPTDKQKKAYTLVLKGHLNVAMLRFEKGTSSYWIDALARKPLRDNGWDYGHGTGHGIDNYIGVHAGPCGLSPSETSYNYKPLEAGNFISDEPGVYFDNEFGVRIESDVSVVEGADGILEFEYLSLVPYARELIEPSLLDQAQIEWVNAYHQRVVAQATPVLEKLGDAETLIWLRKATESI